MVIARLLSNLTSEVSVLGEAEIIVILLGVTLIVALTSRRLRLPYTLLLVLVGLVIGILPVFIEVHLDPNIVLFLFLPALLIIIQLFVVAFHFSPIAAPGCFRLWPWGRLT